MRHVPGTESCRQDGEEMTVAKRTRYRFGETHGRQRKEAEEEKNGLFKRTTLTTRTLSEMTTYYIQSLWLSIGFLRGRNN